MSDLRLILFRRRNGQYRLAACRGENKGCTQIRKRPKKPCPDCVPCEDMNETLEQVMARIARGDA
jgi:hypothetical protein